MNFQAVHKCKCFLVCPKSCPHTWNFIHLSTKLHSFINVKIHKWFHGWIIHGIWMNLMQTPQKHRKLWIALHQWNKNHRWYFVDSRTSFHPNISWIFIHGLPFIPP
jgi:hypothetical protein